jgi:CheY-like chemotaxis protein
MACFLLVEDGSRDAHTATQVAGSVGITDICACHSLKQGVQYLEAFLRGESPRPFAIVVDLDLGFDSGYEVLRLRYSTPQLRTIPTIVWTNLDESARNVCELFDVNAIVFKWEGTAKLREALEEIIDKEQLISASPS